MKIKLLGLLFICCLFLIPSCTPVDPDDKEGEELITTLIYTLTDPLTNETYELSFQDLDGDGGNDAIVSEDVLKSNTAYTGEISLLNETETPVESVDEEVAEEDLDHQLFFISDDLTFAYTDSDSEGNPLGLSTTMATGDAGATSLTIVLKHKPEKSASGVSDNDITNAGGDTDIEVTFNVVIED
jgi:hypothetical protein